MTLIFGWRVYGDAHWEFELVDAPASVPILVPSQSSESTWLVAWEAQSTQGTSTPEREAKALIKGFDLVEVRSGGQLGVDLRKPKGNSPALGLRRELFRALVVVPLLFVAAATYYIQPIGSLSGF